MKRIKIFNSVEEYQTQLKINVPRKITIEGNDYCVFRTEKGLFLMADRCSHEGAVMSLGRCTPSGLIECPWHQFLFEPSTGACVNHICPDMKTYKVTVDSDGVFGHI